MLMNILERAEKAALVRLLPGRLLPLRLALPVLLALLAIVGCDQTGPRTVSLKALGPKTHEFLSRSGAHTYMQFLPGVPPDGINAQGVLYVREYSDFLSHFGQYRPVIGPFASPIPEFECLADAPQWYGDFVVQALNCRDGVIDMETMYTSANSVAVRFLPREGFTSSYLTLTGCAIRPEDGFLTSDVAVESGAVVVRSTANLFSFWGVNVTELWQMTFQTSPTPRELGTDAHGCWQAEVSTTGDPIVVSMTFQATYGADATFDDFVADRAAALDSPGFSDALRTLDLELLAWFDGAPLPNPNDPMSVMSWFLLWENTAAPWGDRWTHRAIVPSKRHYFRGVWLWDAAFNAVLLAGGNADARQLGLDQLRLVIGNAAPDGRIPREIWAHVAGTGTQPPGVLTWAAIALSDRDGDNAVINEFYAPLVKNHAWFVNDNDSDGDGRSEWSKEDSGMDTSPRFDDGPVEGVDLACWLALDAELLAEIATRLGKVAEAAAWRDEAETRKADIRVNFWDATDMYFYDRVIDDGAADPFVRVRTPTAFIPLLIGAADDAQAVAMASHLTDEDYLAAPHGLPTVSTTDPAYEPANYWRGPVWVVTNAFAVWGLERYGLTLESETLRQSTLALVAAQSTPFEYYNSQTGNGIGSPDFMWSGVFYLLLQGAAPIFAR